MFQSLRLDLSLAHEAFLASLLWGPAAKYGKALALMSYIELVLGRPLSSEPVFCSDIYENAVGHHQRAIYISSSSCRRRHLLVLPL